ncbi:MAG: DNRLRE domain-containing protein, partial [Planctomycetes bacterium]|nr:DNRLRE domain-containing protein [Planctomycetota bacterium]
MKKLFAILPVLTVILAGALAPVDAAVLKGPYLIYEGDSTTMTVLWQLDTSITNCMIEWGPTGSYGTSDTALEYGADHQYAYTIVGLLSGTKYYYRITASDSSFIKTGSFTSAPASTATDVKFLAFGDTRADSGLVPYAYDSVCSKMLDTIDDDPGFQTIALHAGDWINSDTEYDWETMFFNRSLPNALDLHATVPIQGCIGNHEGAGTVYEKYYPYPHIDANRFYWSFDYGPIHVLIVDQYTDYSYDSTQYNWCRDELLTTDRKWKFILLHEPAWSADGGHGSNTTAQNFINSLRADGAEIDIVFGGHNHYYARCVVDGIQHITTGGGGAPLRPVGETPAYVVTAESVLQFCEIDIQGDQLDFIARREDGSVLDTFTMIDNYVPSPPQVLFDNPTPGDGTTIYQSQVQIKAIITEEDLASVTFQWDETDYTPYDSSLVLMYNFNNVEALGEFYDFPEAGTLYIKDLSLNGKDAIQGLTNMPSHGESDGFLGSYYFDGVNDSIVVADADGSLAPGAGDFAVALWLKAEKKTDNAIADILNKTSGTGYKLEHSPGGDNKISLSFLTDGTNATIDSTYSYANDFIWHFVVAQRVGNQAELWIDGVREGTATVTGSITNTADLILGSNTAQNGEFYHGDLDELRIYKRSFNSNEIQFLYDSNLSKYLGYEGGSTEWTLDVFRAGLMERDYTYAVSAIDVGLDTGSVQRTVWVDLPNPPDVTLVSPANGSQLNTTTVTFTVDAVDPIEELLKAELYVGTAGQTLTFSGPAETEDAQLYATDDSSTTGTVEGPDYNAGGAVSINVDGGNPHSHGVIKFPNLIGTGPGQVPPGTTIESATIQVNCTNLGAMMQVYRLTSDWSENTVTWNDASSGTPWSIPGGDYDSAVAVNGDCTALGLRTIDVTTFVQAWSDGTDNYGILLTDTSTDGVDFDSSESGNPPLLTVVYTGDWQKVGVTQNLSGASDTATFTDISLNDETDYIWNCLVTNTADVSSWAVSNSNLNIDGQTPDAPVLVRPTDGATGVPIPATLEVTVTDPQPSDMLEVSFYGRPLVSSADDFTIVVLPDTQYYSQNNPLIFDAQTQWIVQNAVADNIVFVTHEGDIVQNYDDQEQEWINARNSMSILDPGLLELPIPTTDPVVPYGMALGNHDLPGAFYNQYFPYTRYEGLEWYGGHYGSDNINTYQLISAGGMDLLILHLQYNPGSTITDPIIAWADGILKTYPDRMAIITTHAFLDANASHVGEGAGIWNVLVQGNDNVYFVLCGHISGEATRTDLVNGRYVHQLLADYQNQPNGGDGWLRVMRFAPSENTVYVETYSPLVDSYETDADSQFTLDVPLNRFELLSTNTGVTNGSNTNFIWTSLAEGDEYEWYATVTDPTAKTSTGPVWSFKTVTRKASNPSPVDGAADVVLDADLSWSAGIDEDSHDIYFGTDPDPRVNTVINQDGTTYEPGTLQQGTTYYWIIDERDSVGGVTPGDIWSFTTLTMKATNPSPADGTTNIGVN